MEEIPLGESRGRVLAQPVTSPIDVPYWDNSAMDGYAVRSEDLKQPDTELEVTETVAAGGTQGRELKPGQCSRIYTGAPVPPGADSVIRQEHTTDLGPGRVRIDELSDIGRNIRRHGEDIRKGEVVLNRGTQIGAAELGLLASVAQDRVQVHARPRVSIVATGDEIVDLDRKESILTGSKIASSNSYTLQALSQEAGAICDRTAIAPDDPDHLKRTLEANLDSDLIVTSAGISVGDRDYVRSVLERLGADIIFWRIRMRPGAPVGYGLVGELPWIGLPGNPVSSMVTFEIFVRPIIRKMLGLTRLFRRCVRARVSEEIRLGPKLTHFLRVTLEESDGEYRASLTGPQGSGILSSMSRADALLVVPEDLPVVSPGTELAALPLAGLLHVEDPCWQ